MSGSEQILCALIGAVATQFPKVAKVLFKAVLLFDTVQQFLKVRLIVYDVDDQANAVELPSALAILKKRLRVEPGAVRIALLSGGDVTLTYLAKIFLDDGEYKKIIRWWCFLPLRIPATTQEVAWFREKFGIMPSIAPAAAEPPDNFATLELLGVPD